MSHRFRSLLAAARQRPGCAAWAVAVLLLGLIGGGYAGSRYAWAVYHYRAGRQALERRDFTQARAHLLLCLQVWPACAEVHLRLAQAARRAGDYQAAEHHLDRCRELAAPADPAGLERMLLRAQRGDLDGVEGYLLHRAEQEGPESVLILEALAPVYLASYHLHGALYCVGRLLELEPENIQALLWHGQVMERLNRFAEALADYRHALALNPDDEQARLSLGEVLLYLDQPQDAAEHFEYLYQRQPGNAAVQFGLACCRRGLGRREEARKLLDGLVTRYPREAPILSERGKLALEEGQAAEAEDWLRRAVALSPFDRRMNYALYQCLQGRGKHAEAKELRAKLERLDQDVKRLLELSKEILNKPQAPAERCEVGILCLRLGLDQAGLGWLAGALREDPWSADAHQALAEYYERSGQPGPAARHRQLARQAQLLRAGRK